MKSDDTIVTADPVTGYCALGIGTYYFDVGRVEETMVASAYVQWAAAVAGVATWWSTGNPAKVGGGTLPEPLHKIGTYTRWLDTPRRWPCLYCTLRDESWCDPT